MKTTVQVSGLTKRYPAVTALDDVSLELAAGRVHLLVGPNGAGKTTLLRALAGLVRPTSGSVTILGKPFSSIERPAHVVGACLDPIRLPALRSGRQHLACLATAAGLPHQRVGEVLEIVGLPAQVAARRAGTYSCGASSATGRAPGAPSWSPATASPSSPRWPTGCSCSTTAD